MEKQEIWVLGQTGQLATCLKHVASQFPQLHLSFFNRNLVNFETGLSNQLDALSGQPHCIINTAAYTSVDLAEQEFSKANRINGEAVQELITWAQSKGIPVIHFSTDYVFNGANNIAYTESDVTNPINAYGASKLLGEKAVLNYARGIVFRISWLYSSVGKNFLLTMKNKMNQGAPLQVVNDQIGCPTSAHALANDLLRILQEKKLTEQTFGLYHYSHEGQVSWFEFATEIKSQLQANSNLTAVSSEEFKTAAKRPAFSKLNPTKTLSTFGLPHRNWKEELINELNNIHA